MALLFLLLLIVPLAELFVVIEVWQRIGGLETVFLLIMVSLAGAWLVRREGLAVWYRLNEQLARGQLPANELIDGALILFAGALMLTPGFITDAVGLLLLFPVTRAGARALVRRRFRGRLLTYAAASRGVRFATFGPRSDAGAGHRSTRVYTVDDIPDGSAGAGGADRPGPFDPPPRELGT
jgi:UPF0716 protein FxsA